MTGPVCHVNGKLRYGTEREARIELAGCFIGRNRGKNQRKENRVYPCPYCRGWHLTSTPFVPPTRKTTP